MPSTPDPNSLSSATPASGPGNAFHPAFLEALGQLGDAPSGSEAELSGPWRVRPSDGGFAVLRQFEDEGAGDVPEAVFEHREHALLLAAVLAAVGREPTFRLQPSKSEEGFAIDAVWGQRWVNTVGRLQRFQPEVVEALQLADALVRSPIALAHLLEAAGPTALELAGRILSRHLGSDGEDAGEDA